MRLPMAVFVALAFAVSLATGTTLLAATGSESLESQLLEDLPSGGPQPPADEERASKSDEGSNLDFVPRSSPVDPPDPEIRFHPLRFDDVSGQDVSQPSGPLRLVRAGQGMAQAEALLRERATVARAGETQRQVVQQLDELIAELSKQCNCSGSGKPGEKPPSPSQRSQARPGKSASKPGRGNAPARDSNAQLTDKAAQPVNRADLDELVKQLWGHLPERQREQMLQSFSDEFLPKYELEIEKYYERLSDEEPSPPQ